MSPAGSAPRPGPIASVLHASSSSSPIPPPGTSTSAPGAAPAPPITTPETETAVSEAHEQLLDAVDLLGLGRHLGGGRAVVVVQGSRSLLCPRRQSPGQAARWDERGDAEDAPAATA